MSQQERIERLEAEVDALREEMRVAVAGMEHIFEAGREYERSTRGPRPVKRHTPGPRPVNPHLRVMQ